MPFDFPNSPTLGQNATAPNGAVFVWDGAKWTTAANAATIGAGGPFLPLSGGTMAGGLNYTATGSTTSRAAQDRTAEVINVKDFGAKGDGTTDDTTAINAAVAHLRTTAGPADHWTAQLVFPAGRYVVTGPLNFTGIANIATPVVIDGCGSELWLKSTTAVVDCLSSRWLTFRDLAIYGDPTTPPRIGMQVGRISTAGADVHTLINMKFYGNFTLTGFYNFASETTSAYSCTFDNNATTANAYCVIQDGINHWGVSSTFVTTTVAANTPQSNNGNTFYACTFQGNAAPGNVWLANINSHVFHKCYASNVTGSIFVLYSYTVAAPAATFLELDCHCETTGLQHMLAFTGAAGVNYALVNGLLLSDYALQANASVLATDATVSVDIRGARFYLNGSTPALFDQPGNSPCVR